jgi:hypothetical protein
LVSGYERLKEWERHFQLGKRHSEHIMLGLVRAGIAGDRSSGDLLSASCNLQLSYAEDPSCHNTLLYRRIAYGSSTTSTRSAPTSLRSTRVLTHQLSIVLFIYHAIPWHSDVPCSSPHQVWRVRQAPRIQLSSPPFYITFQRTFKTHSAVSKS